MDIGIDPGSSYTGVALGSPEIFETLTLGPDEAGGWLESLFETGQVRAAACEEFKLYPWMADEQGFSELRVVEVIGVVKYLTRKHDIPLVMTKPLWKKPVAAWMAKQGISEVGNNQHEVDAGYALWAARRKGLLP